MSEGIEQARQVLQDGIVQIAETRLGRALSMTEANGIKRIQSLMMLESIEQSFGHEATSPDQIEKDLQALAQQTDAL
ncbi:MAG: hypothetical protein JNJ50_20975 [Acidobacteria bacterium]|nr:hypothetical protein [Acidobacteriota bacterium]